MADKGQTKECQHTHVFIASSSQLFRLSADSSGVLVATTSPSIPKPVHKKKTVVRGLLPGKGLRMGLLRTRLDNVASSAMESISRV